MGGTPALLYVPTRGYVFHETANTLARILSRAGVPPPIYTRNTVSVAAARNEIVARFLDESDAEILIMCDDDVVPPDNVLDVIFGVLRRDYYSVCAAPVLIVRPGTVHLPNVFAWNEKLKMYDIDMSVFERKSGVHEVEAVGTGFIAIKRKLLEHQHMQAPFNQQMNKNGTIKLGEDLSFCQRARKRGFRIAVCMDVLCEHHTAIYATGVAAAYSRQIQAYMDDVKKGGEGTAPLPASLPV